MAIRANHSPNENSRTPYLEPLILPDGSRHLLSLGKKSKLQVSVFKEFYYRFASGSTVLYIGDSKREYVLCKYDELTDLNIPIYTNIKLPDIILSNQEQNKLFLIKVAIAKNLITTKSQEEFEIMLSDCPADRIYVTAFRDKNTFRRYADIIAWDSIVWLADDPDHLIHYCRDPIVKPHERK